MIRAILTAMGGLAAAAALVGCGSVPRPSDAGVARQALAAALDGWKNGDSFDAYKQAHPTVTVVDEHWKKGVKLASYEFDGEPVEDGYDMQFKVKMVVHDAAGKQSKQKAIYNVSTSPNLVIVRMEPAGGG